MTTTVQPRTTAETCFLYEAAGRPVRCQRERCSFWEDGECALERLGLRAEAEARPELAAWLLELRSELSANALEFPEEPLPPYNLLPLPGFRR